MEKSGQKRASVHKENIVEDAKAILLELEGATVPVGFVKEKLYGYVKEHANDFLTTKFDDVAVQDNIVALRTKVAADVAKGIEGITAIPEKKSPKADIVTAVVHSIEWHLGKGLMTSTVEKIIVQILKEAYHKEADILTELFDDVAPALKQWADKGIKVYVLSSRSAEFQKLLFANSKDGDVSEMISGFEDLAERPKSVKETYVKVADDLKMTPGDIFYLTTSVNEATAACAAGMQTYLVVRDGSIKPDDLDKETFSTIHVLTELLDSGKADGIPQKKISRSDAKSDPATVHN